MLTRRRRLSQPPRGVSIREGSYFVSGTAAPWCRWSTARPSSFLWEGLECRRRLRQHARIVRKLIPIRDAVRGRSLSAGTRPAVEAGAGSAAHRLVSSFVRDFGPINTTMQCRPLEDEEAGEVQRDPPPPESGSVRAMTRIAGSSPRSRTMTSRPTRRSPGRSLPSA